MGRRRVIDADVLAFTAVAALLTLAPGPDTALVVRSAVTRGRRAGLLTVLGICSGLFVHAGLSAAGVSMLLVRSATLFTAVRWAGAVYLVVLGVQSLCSAVRVSTGPPPGERPGTGRRAFTTGLLTNLLNPKVAVFYLAFLPQFVRPDDPALAKSMLLAAIHVVQGLLWLSLVTLGIARLRKFLGHPRARRGLEGAIGVALVGFGARLALERR